MATYDRKNTHEAVGRKNRQHAVASNQTHDAVDRKGGEQSIGNTEGPETVDAMRGLEVVKPAALVLLPSIGGKGIVTFDWFGYGFGLFDVGHGERLGLFAKCLSFCVERKVQNEKIENNESTREMTVRFSGVKRRTEFSLQHVDFYVGIYALFNLFHSLVYIT